MGRFVCWIPSRRFECIVGMVLADRKGNEIRSTQHSGRRIYRNWDNRSSKWRSDLEVRGSSEVGWHFVDRMRRVCGCGWYFVEDHAAFRSKSEAEVGPALFDGP